MRASHHARSYGGSGGEPWSAPRIGGRGASARQWIGDLDDMVDESEQSRSAAGPMHPARKHVTPPIPNG